MNVLLDCQYVRMWTDGGSSILYSLLKAVPEQSNSARDLFNLTHEISNSFRKKIKLPVYSIVDVQSIGIGRASECFVSKFLSAQVQADVTRHCIITGPQLSWWLNLSVDPTLPDARLFPSFTDALIFINRRIVEGFAQDDRLKEKTILGFLF